MKKELRLELEHIISNCSNKDISCIETMISREKLKRKPPETGPKLYGKCEECLKIDNLYDFDGCHLCDNCIDMS